VVMAGSFLLFCKAGRRLPDGGDRRDPVLRIQFVRVREVYRVALTSPSQ